MESAELGGGYISPSSEVHLLVESRRVHLPDAKTVRLEAHGREEGAGGRHDEVDQGDPHHLERNCADRR